MMGWNYYNMMGGYGGSWWWHLGGMIIWAIIAFAIVYAVIKITNSPGRKTEIDEPLNILKIRYSKGDITLEEFEKRKKELGYK